MGVPPPAVQLTTKEKRFVRLSRADIAGHSRIPLRDITTGKDSCIDRRKLLRRRLNYAKDASRETTMEVPRRQHSAEAKSQGGREPREALEICASMRDANVQDKHKMRNANVFFKA